MESLANLANRLRFAKLKSSKVAVTPLVDLFIHQILFCQTLKRLNSPNILPPNFLAIRYLNYRSVSLQECRNLWYCFISEFFRIHVSCIQHMSHKCMGHTVCISHLDCSVGQVGQQVWPTSTLDPTLILA